MPVDESLTRESLTASSLPYKAIPFPQPTAAIPDTPTQAPVTFTHVESPVNCGAAPVPYGLTTIFCRAVPLSDITSVSFQTAPAFRLTASPAASTTELA